MSAPKASTLVIVGAGSAAAFAAALGFVIHTFQTVAGNPLQIPLPTIATVEPATPRRATKIDVFTQGVAQNLGIDTTGKTPVQVERELYQAMEQQRREQNAMDPAAARRARNHSIAPPSWERALREATDLKVFMDEVVPVADGGDTSAQFAVYLAMAECGTPSLLANASPRIQARCKTSARPQKEMRSEAARWLDRSAAGNYPRALAQRALNRIVEGRKARWTKAEREQQMNAAQADLIKALNSDDAAITWFAGAGVTMLHADDARAEHAIWVWRLAACDQGLQCDASAPWLPELCGRAHDCVAGEDGRDYIRRQADDLASLHARARELAITLRGGKLDAETFNATLTSLPPVRPRNTAKASEAAQVRP